jgi:adenylylsulfate kinase
MVSTAASGMGFTVWLTGTPGARPSRIVDLLATEFRDRGLNVEVLDDDVAFSEDIEAKARRIAWGCELLNRNGIVAIAAAISPDRAGRIEVPSRIVRYVEVELEAPDEVSAERDATADVTIPTDGTDRPEESVAGVVARLEDLGYLARREGQAGAAYTADEESEVTDRLRDLGYL